MGEGEAEAKNGVESISKSLAAVLAAIYFLGFLVVTRHLSQYGVSPLAILKLQYLTAGVWLIAALGWPCLILVALSTMDLVPSDKGKDFLRNLFSWSTLFAMGFSAYPS